MDLRGKTVLVTGAARGLGQAMARAVAARGANLALLDLDRGALQDSMKACQQAGVKARDYAVDVTDEAAVESAFNAVHSDFAGLDAVINNAGVNHDALLVKATNGKVEKKMSLSDFNKVIAVDLVGVFLCGREAAVHMIESGRGGVIINISSISRAGNVGQTNYSAAKAGVSAMCVAWAKELARYNIRVGAIAPGFCNTQMVAKMPDRILQRIISTIPLGRLAEPEEIGRAAVFILENDYFSGRTLEIDGALRL